MNMIKNKKTFKLIPILFMMLFSFSLVSIFAADNFDVDAARDAMKKYYNNGWSKRWTVEQQEELQTYVEKVIIPMESINQNIRNYGYNDGTNGKQKFTAAGYGMITRETLEDTKKFIKNKFGLEIDKNIPDKSTWKAKESEEIQQYTREEQVFLIEAVLAMKMENKGGIGILQKGEGLYGNAFSEYGSYNDVYAKLYHTNLKSAGAEYVKKFNKLAKENGYGMINVPGLSTDPVTDIINNHGGDNGKGGLTEFDRTGDVDYNVDGLVACEGTGCGLKGMYMTVTNVVSFLTKLGYMAVTLAFIWAGVIILTAGGETAPRDKAKKIFKNAIIGMLLIAAASAIISLIISIFVNDSDIDDNPLLNKINTEERVR